MHGQPGADPGISKPEGGGGQNKIQIVNIMLTSITVYICYAVKI